jgi:hypothetical protein
MAMRIDVVPTSITATGRGAGGAAVTPDSCVSTASATDHSVNHIRGTAKDAKTAKSGRDRDERHQGSAVADAARIGKRTALVLISVLSRIGLV